MFRTGEKSKALKRARRALLFLALAFLSINVSIHLDCKVKSLKISYDFLSMAFAGEPSLNNRVQTFYASVDASSAPMHGSSSSSSSSGGESSFSSSSGGPDYWVYAFYDSAETFPYPDDEKNNPSISFITFIPVTWEYCMGNYNRVVYTGGQGNIRVKMTQNLFRSIPKYYLGKKRGESRPYTGAQKYVDSWLPYQIVNLTANGLDLQNVDEALNLDGDTVTWGGIFKALDTGNGQGIASMKRALEATNNCDGNNARRNSYQMLMGEGGSAITVLAFKDWNYHEKAKEIDFVFLNMVTYAGDLVAKVIPYKMKIKLNVDNYDFVRERPTRVPGADPGKFIPKGAETIANSSKRTYHDNIIWMKTEEANGNLEFQSGGGVDPSQVSAVYLCNSEDATNPDVVRCAHRFIAKHLEPTAKDKKGGRGLAGQVWPKKPEIVYINPFSRWIRLNGHSVNSYGGYDKKARPCRDRHELTHSYHNFPGRGVVDLDRDTLVPSANYIRAAIDSRERGFVATNRQGDKRIGEIIEGYSGDNRDLKYQNWAWRGNFATRIDNVLSTDIGNNELHNVVFGHGINRDVPTEIPRDLPSSLMLKISYDRRRSKKPIYGTTISNPLFTREVEGVYLYHPTKKKYGGMLGAGKKWVKIKLGPAKMENYAYGGYSPTPTYFNFEPFRSVGNESRDAFRKITKEGYGLYVLYKIHYGEKDRHYPRGFRKIHPIEFDCDHFGYSGKSFN